MHVAQSLILLLFVFLTNCAFYPTQCPRLRPVNTSVFGVALNQKPRVLEAIKGWNRKLNYNYFVLNDYHPSLSIRTGELKERYGFAGMFEQYPENQSLIVLDKNVSDLTLLLVAYHELGHAIGLEHVSDSWSIMYPMVQGLKAVEPSETDVQKALDILEKKK